MHTFLTYFHFNDLNHVILPFSFLNDEMEGGEAVFPRSVTAESHSGIEIIPKKGKALLFYNMLEDGNVDSLSQHASNEVLKGEKWIANMWIWDPIIN